jgi:type VI secretion system protein VasD
MKQILKPILTLIFMVFIISGCSSKPTHIELVVQSAKDLNPDLDNVSSPLMLTFYELESAEKFLKYDFWKLLNKSGKKLGDDLVSQAKHVIVPQQEQVYKIVFEKNTKFLGVIGKFRNIENKSAWKYVINLEQEKYNYIELKIKNINIERAE